MRSAPATLPSNIMALNLAFDPLPPSFPTFDFNKMSVDAQNTTRPSTADDDEDYDFSTDEVDPRDQRPTKLPGRLEPPDQLASLSQPPQPAQLCALRRSITESSVTSVDRFRRLSRAFKDNFPNASTSALDYPPAAPPTYEEYLAEATLPRWRGKILPREEEGHEELPGYTCTIEKEALLAVKVECENPFERSSNRAWKTRYLVLQGTKLEIREPKASSMFVKGDGWKPFTLAKKVQYGPGRLVDSFTMQLAEAGMATDYRRLVPSPLSIPPQTLDHSELRLRAWRIVRENSSLRKEMHCFRFVRF